MSLLCRILLTPSESVSSLNRPAASVQLTNETDSDIEISWIGHPFIHLDLVVTAQDGRVISRSFYGAAYAGHRPEIQHLRLKPGQSYLAPISPFATVEMHEIR